MSLLALSDSFEYLCYGSTKIKNIFTLTVRGSTLVVTTKVDPRKLFPLHLNTYVMGLWSLEIF